MIKHRLASSRKRGPVTTDLPAESQAIAIMDPRFRGEGKFRGGLTATAVLMTALALSACGTKGDLECPKGTVPQIDGTCRPPPPAK